MGIADDPHNEWTRQEVIDMLEWLQFTTNRDTDRFLMSKISAKSLLEIYEAEQLTTKTI
jgi:hypothetical protein